VRENWPVWAAWVQQESSLPEASVRRLVVFHADSGA
jgi:hypothetical protein